MDAIRVQQSNMKAKHEAFWQFGGGSGALVEWESLVLSSWVSWFLWWGVVMSGDGRWAFKRNLPFKKQVWAVPFMVTQASSVMMSSMGLRTCTKTSYGDAAVPGHQSKMNWTEPILKSEFAQPVALPGGSCHSLLRCRPGASLIWRGQWRHPYRGCTADKKQHEAWNKFFGHCFQSSARVLIVTSCFALHWHCFLLLYTIQHWLFFWSLPGLSATCLTLTQGSVTPRLNSHSCDRTGQPIY